MPAHAQSQTLLNYIVIVVFNTCCAELNLDFLLGFLLDPFTLHRLLAI